MGLVDQPENLGFQLTTQTKVATGGARVLRSKMTNIPSVGKIGHSKFLHRAYIPGTPHVEPRGCWKKNSGS